MPALHEAFRANSRAFALVTPEPQPEHSFLKTRIRRRWRAAEMLGRFAGELKRLARDIQSRFEGPGEDWPVLVFVLPPDGAPVSLSVPYEWMQGDQSREILARTMNHMVVEHHAVALALFCPSWLRVPLSEQEPERAQTAPGFFEALTIQMIRAHSVERYVARIHRQADQAATLGNWIRLEAGEDEEESPHLMTTGALIRDNHKQFVTLVSPLN